MTKCGGRVRRSESKRRGLRLALGRNKERALHCVRRRRKGLVVVLGATNRTTIRYIGVDDIGIGVDVVGIGADVKAIEVDVIGIGVDDIGIGVDVVGIGVDVIGIEKDVIGIGVDDIGIGVDDIGIGVDVVGIGVDVTGIGVDVIGAHLQREPLAEVRLGCGSKRNARLAMRKRLCRPARRITCVSDPLVGLQRTNPISKQGL
eukprot:5200863-Pyramimonas_sp.AAC.1